MTIYADAIASLAVLSLFLLAFYGPWQSIMVDMSRQYVLEQRDAVFDLAARGKLDFNSEDYRIIRDAFNKLIRFAHEFNWIRLLMYWDGGRSVPEVSHAVDRIEDQETRTKVAYHLRRARFAMIAMMVGKSLGLLAGAAIVGLISWCMGKTRDIFLKMDRAFGEKMQVEAELA